MKSALRRCARLSLGLLATTAALRAAPTHLVDESPVRITTVAPGVHWVDFGRAAFGNLRLLPPVGATGEITVHFGEALAPDGRIDRQPPGTVRYNLTAVRLAGIPVVAAPPPDVRNTWVPGKTDFRAIAS